MIGRLDAHEGMSEAVKVELVEVIQEAFTLSMGRKRLRQAKIQLLGVNLMAQITYRGVKYNAEQYKAKVLAEQDQRRNHDYVSWYQSDRKFASKAEM